MRVFLAIASYGWLLDGKGNPRCLPFCTSLAGTIELLAKSGFEIDALILSADCYISHARDLLVTAFMESPADCMVFLDDDLEWNPEDLLKLIGAGDVVAGIYRKKTENEDYPVAIDTHENGYPVVRQGLISAMGLPTGFLMISRRAVEELKAAHPELRFIEDGKEHYDLFPQGVHEGKWWGEDFAFCRMWRELGERAWIVPDLTLTHWGRDKDGKDKAFTGNYHEFLLRQPGGSKAA